MTIYLHQGDLPHDVFAPGPIAVDSETMGLHPHRDRLCLVQLADGNGDEHLVRFAKGQYHAPVLKSVLTDPSRIKLYHFARFDLAVMKQYLGVMAGPVFCTKIASKLIRTYTEMAQACFDFLPTRAELDLAGWDENDIFAHL